MELAYRKMNAEEIDRELSGVDGWRMEGDKLAKQFEFEAYKDGIVFASAVGYVADSLNHHPDISIGYKKVNIAVNTHDVGGISPYDFELARRINSLG
jgi:4a-hydroxytetrahydrobiopterin dehydratase